MPKRQIKGHCRPMTDPSTSPETLAAGLVARLLHDIAGAASGVSTGLELHAESADPTLKADALELTAASAASLLDVLAFARAAFAPGGETVDGARIEQLAKTVFAGRRATLAWAVRATDLSPLAVQVLLILTQIAAAGLGAGGVLAVSAARDGSRLRLTLMGEGPRARFQAEAVEGLRGERLSSGLAGRWAPAAYVHGLLIGVGGGVTAEQQADRFALQAVLPH